MLQYLKEEYPCKIVNAYSMISQETCQENKVMLSYRKNYCNIMNFESEACHLVAKVISEEN